MRLPWRKRAARPTPLPAVDEGLVQAAAAVDRARSAVDAVERRTEEVRVVGATLREIRAKNHFGPRMRVLLQNQPDPGGRRP